MPGVSTRVTRQARAPGWKGRPIPASCLVPLAAGVHDRAWVEVMRGCTRGCRFCQAGMWYRPVRERPADEVLAWPSAQLAATGHRGTGLRLALHHRLLVPDRMSDGSGARASRGQRLAAVAAGGQRGGATGLAGLAHRELADPGPRGRQPAHAGRHQQERDRGGHPGRRRGGLPRRAGPRSSCTS